MDRGQTLALLETLAKLAPILLSVGAQLLETGHAMYQQLTDAGYEVSPEELRAANEALKALPNLASDLASGQQDGAA